MEIYHEWREISEDGVVKQRCHRGRAPRVQPRRSSTPFDEVVKRALNRSKNASAACRGPGLLVILVASL